MRKNNNTDTLQGIMAVVAILALFVLTAGCTPAPLVSVQAVMPAVTMEGMPSKIIAKKGEVMFMAKPVNTTWKSSNQSVAMVGSKDGQLVITATGKGNTEIIGTQDEDMGVGPVTRIQIIVQ